jgi:hypothetical protein
MDLAIMHALPSCLLCCSAIPLHFPLSMVPVASISHALSIEATTLWGKQPIGLQGVCACCLVPELNGIPIAPIPILYHTMSALDTLMSLRVHGNNFQRI